jgi:Tol biopolymer transport system component
MSAYRDLEQVLRVHLNDRGDRTVLDGQLDAIVDRVGHTRQRAAWVAALRSPSMTSIAIPVRRALPRPAWVLVAIGVLALLALAAFAAGSRPNPGPPVNGRIVFGRFDSAQGDTVIYTVNSDGSHLLRLRPETYECPYWSPDSKQITTTSVVMNGDGTGFHLFRVQPGPVSYGCGIWSADGKLLAVEGWNDNDPSYNGLYTIRSADGGDLKRLTTSGAQHDIPIGYSPDGSMIALMHELGANQGNRLFLVDADGTNRRQLSDLTIGGGDWAPDGRSILVSSNGQLIGIDIASGAQTHYAIAASPGARLSGPQWSPDGARILFGQQVNGKSDVFTMLRDGTDVVQVTNDPDNDYFADWGTYPIQR